MRRIVLTLALLLAAEPLRAGVYNLDPPRRYPNDYVETHTVQQLKWVMAYLDELRAVRDLRGNQPPTQPGTLRDLYEKQLAPLESKRNAGQLTVVDRVNLSACLIRLGRNAKAQELLEESLHRTAGDDPYRVLLQLNLAAIYQEDESLMQRGLQMQRDALAHWPKLLLGWTRGESEWYRHVEEYVLTLMEMRTAETIRQSGTPSREQPLFDRLFPRESAKKVKFAGDNGEYEAGAIAWKEWDRLPVDAEQIVLQLLLWRPHDVRLLWLYGELLNARGEIDWAYTLLNVKVREQSLWRNRELDRHIQVLKAADKVYKVLFVDEGGTGENLRRQALLLWQFAPRGASPMPGVAEAVHEAGGITAATYLGVALGNQTPSAPATSGRTASMALPDWRHLTVSFLTGVIVAVLGVLQWQQWRRHRSFRGEPAA
jgi:hypothetical protein